MINFKSSINSNKLDTLVNDYEIIAEDIEIKDNGDIMAIREISPSKQIMIIPIKNVISSEEEYQFNQYFSRSSKEKLIGRLLIEKFLGNESIYNSFIEDLPKPNQLLDYYHYDDETKKEFERRSLVKYIYVDRKSEYDSLIRKIPSNVLN